MEFKELMAKRRSIRKYSPRRVPEEVIQRMLKVALSAPSSRNSRSTRFLVVDDPTLIARMAEMRDYGSSFMASAPLAIVVMGDTTTTDLWQVNCAISATVLQQAAVDEGLASCWVHIAGRPRLKSEPEGAQAEDFLREFLPIPAECKALCAMAIGYSDFEPKPLPEDATERVIWMK